MENGEKVKVVKLDSVSGFLISPKHLRIRKKGKIGIIRGWVPGHGGDVWWVEQDNGVAAYSTSEFEKIID